METKIYKVHLTRGNTTVHPLFNDKATAVAYCREKGETCAKKHKECGINWHIGLYVMQADENGRFMEIGVIDWRKTI